MGRRDVGLKPSEHGRADGENLLAAVLGLVDDLAGLGGDDQPLGIHPVFGQILHINPAELTDAHVLGDESFVNILEDHHVEQLAAEMCAGRRNGHRAFVLGEDCLVVLVVLRRDLGLDPFRDRNLTEAEQGFLEFLVRAVVKEAQGAPPGGCVVDDFGHKALIVTEIQLVANPDFPCRIHNHIPQVLLTVELPQKKDHDVGPCLLLFAVKTGRENLCVVEHESVAFAEIVYDVFEYPVLDLSGVLVDNHQPALVAPPCRLLSHTLLRKKELEL